MPLTEYEKEQLLDIVVLIAERDMPSNNTEERLIERSGLEQETVAWCLSVLWNEGEGWLDVDEHPQTGEWGYTLNGKFDKGESIEKLHTAFLAQPKAVKAGENELELELDDED